MSVNETPKVSVVIPMYNIGKYAFPCIQSLLNQTYKNVEIIIVDDGSTDDTVCICNSAIGDDTRAIVLKKRNGGLSSARNFGLVRSTGDYIMFVDGDDVLDKSAIDHLVSTARQYDVSLVTCLFKKIKASEKYAGKKARSVDVVTGDELLRRMLLLNGESGSACAKLYSRKLYPLLVFPEGQLFEDFGVVATVLASIDTACVSNAELYGYVTRTDSITAEKKYGDFHLLGMESSLEVVRQIILRKQQLSHEFFCFETFCFLRIASKLDIEKCSDEKRALSYIQKARDRCHVAAFASNVALVWRIRCEIFSISPTVYRILYRVFGKLTGKVIG